MEVLEQAMTNAHIYDLESLVRSVNGWKLKSDKIVFTNGCFDILHRGHVEYLEEAAQLGDRLIVAVNSDESVRGLDKAPGRPLNNEHDRALLIASLRCVDAVVIFSESTPLETIEAIKPDVLVKGGDWAVADIVGGKEVQAAGGEVHSLKLVDGYSTTDLIDRIRNA